MVALDGAQRRRRHHLTVTMSTSAEPNPKQNDATNDEINSLNKDNLLDWIQRKLPIPLKPEDAEKFLDVDIDGYVFSNHAGDRDFFISAGFSFGVSDKLAILAKEATGRKRKYSHGHHTDCQLTTSQETVKKPDLRSGLTPHSKEGVQTAKSMN